MGFSLVLLSGFHLMQLFRCWAAYFFLFSHFGQSEWSKKCQLNRCVKIRFVEMIDIFVCKRINVSCVFHRLVRERICICYGWAMVQTKIVNLCAHSIVLFQPFNVHFAPMNLLCCGRRERRRAPEQLNGKEWACWWMRTIQRQRLRAKGPLFLVPSLSYVQRIRACV